jgi:hypothetical protein
MTRPCSTGSPPLKKMIGFVVVATFAANAEGKVAATIAVTLCGTNSRARAGRRS